MVPDSTTVAAQEEFKWAISYLLVDFVSNLGNILSRIIITSEHETIDIKILLMIR